MKTALTLLLALAAACSSGGAVPTPSPGTVLPHATTQVLLLLTEFDTEEEELKEADQLREKVSGVAIERIGNTSIFVLQLPAGADLNAVLKDLDDDAAVIASELDYLAESPEGGPEDLPTLGSDLLSSIPTQPGLAGLDLAQAHAVTRGAGVVVAVVDTGVDAGHPALAGRVLPGGFDFLGSDADPSEERNFVDDDGDGLVDEQYGHGTFISSLILAVAPEAMILPVRVLDAEGFGTASSVAAGIVWAVDAGADVINVSVDIPDASEIVKQAVSYAEDRDVVVVAAAGNGGATRMIFPARFSDVMGIVAADETGRVPAFSNTGDRASLVAPGVDLVGAVPMPLNPQGTARWSGTSFSAPIVAGSAALVRSAFPGIDRAGVRQRLESTAMPVDAMNPQHMGRLGRGLVQPAAAVGP